MNPNSPAFDTPPAAKSQFTATYHSRISVTLSADLCLYPQHKRNACYGGWDWCCECDPDCHNKHLSCAKDTTEVCCEYNSVLWMGLISWHQHIQEHQTRGMWLDILTWHLHDCGGEFRVHCFGGHHSFRWQTIPLLSFMSWVSASVDEKQVNTFLNLPVWVQPVVFVRVQGLLGAFLNTPSQFWGVWLGGISVKFDCVSTISDVHRESLEVPECHIFALRCFWATPEVTELRKVVLSSFEIQNMINWFPGTDL